MFVELAKRLKDVDDSYKLSLNITDDGVYTIAIEGNESIDDTYYSYSSTDIYECYVKAMNFIECLKDTDKFENLLNNILNKPLEV